ncbi:MAG TPA: hypothetical protein PKA64_15815 [Myxococcota bacterium]|nr:hypothetical protein [Myxococcota bacterium]
MRRTLLLLIALGACAPGGADPKDTDTVPVSDDSDAADTDTNEVDTLHTDADDTDAADPADTDPADTDLVETDLADTDLADTDRPDTDVVDTDPGDTDDTDAAADPCARPAVRLGVPGPPIELLQGGETVMVEAGPQGGFHIWFAAELDVVSGQTTLHTTIDLIGGPRVSDTQFRLVLTPVDCRSEVDTIQAVLDYLAVGLNLRDLDNQPAHVTLTASQPGRSLTAEADVIIDVP